MDSLGVCSICSVSRNLFIPLLCNHTICLECSLNEQLNGTSLVCPICSQPTELEPKTVERLKEAGPTPQAQQYKQQILQLESAFNQTMENVKKIFSYLHQQLSLKSQALIDALTRQYQSELNKLEFVKTSLKQTTGLSSPREISSTFSKFLRMLKGPDYSINISPLEKQILDLEFNFHRGPHVHKYARCSHQQPKSQEKSRNFQSDKSYNKIMNILNKSRCTLQSHMKSIKRGQTFRSSAEFSPQANSKS